MIDIQFKNWLDDLIEIWETRNPGEIVGLVADDFEWYETPFDEPFTTKDDLLKEWQEVLKQKDISVRYKIVSINENMSIAQWHAIFTRLPSQESAELDGIFQITLDTKGKCIEFRQWYNSK